jgi:hypothetical protein
MSLIVVLILLTPGRCRLLEETMFLEDQASGSAWVGNEFLAIMPHRTREMRLGCSHKAATVRVSLSWRPSERWRVAN